jgi:hypothetical protein
MSDGEATSCGIGEAHGLKVARGTLELFGHLCVAWLLLISLAFLAPLVACQVGHTN